MSKSKCQMKEKVHFIIDRIPPVDIWHWAFDIHALNFSSLFKELRQSDLHAIKLPFFGCAIATPGLI